MRSRPWRESSTPADLASHQPGRAPRRGARPPPRRRDDGDKHSRPRDRSSARAGEARGGQSDESAAAPPTHHVEIGLDARLLPADAPRLRRLRVVADRAESRAQPAADELHHERVGGARELLARARRPAPAGGHRQHRAVHPALSAHRIPHPAPVRDPHRRAAPRARLRLGAGLPARHRSPRCRGAVVEGALQPEWRWRLQHDPRRGRSRAVRVAQRRRSRDPGDRGPGDLGVVRHGDDHLPRRTHVRTVGALRGGGDRRRGHPAADLACDPAAVARHHPDDAPAAAHRRVPDLHGAVHHDRRRTGEPERHDPDAHLPLRVRVRETTAAPPH